TPGLRLANMALRHVYGMRDIIADAPRFLSAKPVPGGMEITFSHVAGGLQIRSNWAGDDGKKLIGFAIANEQRKWIWTTAEIIAPDKVLVHYPPQMPAPVAIRYNWAQFCFGNLYSTAGLPAEPFRTDDWPYLTAGKR
ncbi:MAG: 9-O-acetylesterase, partial [Prosthecobacter sp.]